MKITLKRKNNIKFRCTKCGRTFTRPSIRCPYCSSLVRAEIPKQKEFKLTKHPGIWKFSNYLPKIPSENIISLDEGFTPLIKAKNFASLIKLENVFIKDETRNPTGSFRDRVATLIVSHAKHIGAKKLVCATDGNLGASVSAYSAKAGLKCVAVVPSNADYGKILQMEAFGAEIYEYGKIIDEAVVKAKELVLSEGIYEATAEENTLSIEGLKTIAYELAMQLNRINWLVIPAGSGLTLLSTLIGFNELVNLGILKRKPKILVVQSNVCSPIVDSLKQDNVVNEKEASIVKKHIPGLDVCKTPLLKYILQYLDYANTYGVRITYTSALNYVSIVAKSEGLFIEPAGAAAFAGLTVFVRKTENISKSENVVVLAPATGLKVPLTYSKEPSRRKYGSRLAGLSTKALILNVLREHGEMHGYKIWKTLGLSVTVQAIYQHLEELERAGLVESKKAGKKKLYKLTKKGYEVVLALK